MRQAEGWDRKPTCHTNGKFLKFVNTKRIARSLHTPPDALTPDHFVTKARKAGLLAKAARDAPEATRLTTLPMMTTREAKGQYRRNKRTGALKEWKCTSAQRAESAYLYGKEVGVRISQSA